MALCIGWEQLIPETVGTTDFVGVLVHALRKRTEALFFALRRLPRLACDVDDVRRALRDET
jgi:hypothetical protein